MSCLTTENVLFVLVHFTGHRKEGVGGDFDSVDLAEVSGVSLMVREGGKVELHKEVLFC